MTTFDRDTAWLKAMTKLGTLSAQYEVAIPESLSRVLTEDTANRMLELAETFYMGNQRNALGRLLRTDRTSPEFICARINSLYAFRHLADPNGNSENEKATLIHLICAIDGLASYEFRFEAVDYSHPSRFKSANAHLTVVMGVMNIGIDEWRGRRLLKFRNGIFYLPLALRRVVEKHPDYAETIVRLIKERGLVDEAGVIDELLSSNPVAALIDGAL